MKSGRVSIRVRWRRKKSAPEPDPPGVVPGQAHAQAPEGASLPPETLPFPSAVEPTPEPSQPQYKWYHKMAGLFAVIFCFELGVFLLVFPWASDWDLNYFSSLPLWASSVWASPYFRGAISGLGVLNIYVSLIEVFRLRRFSASSAGLS